MKHKVGVSTDTAQIRQFPRRLSADARAQMILEEAVRFFSERGVNAQIRDLAERLKVSPATIFQYFGTKQNLIDQVYERVYAHHWSDDWLKELANRAVPLEERIESFYLAYLEEIDTPEWIRLALFAGLMGERLPSGSSQRALEIILAEMRAQRGLPKGEPTAIEWETAWHLHSTAMFFLMRKYVFRMPPPVDREEAVRRMVKDFFSGIESAPGVQMQGGGAAVRLKNKDKKDSEARHQSTKRSAKKAGGSR